MRPFRDAFHAEGEGEIRGGGRGTVKGGDFVVVRGGMGDEAEAGGKLHVRRGKVGSGVIEDADFDPDVLAI